MVLEYILRLCASSGLRISADREVGSGMQRGSDRWARVSGLLVGVRLSARLQSPDSSSSNPKIQQPSSHNSNPPTLSATP